MKPAVLVAMSGGVDSSVAALLLAEQGHRVAGVTMGLHGQGEAPGGRSCCTPADAGDARRVASRLGIRHYLLDLSSEFESEVVEPFVRAYASGLTPNPCILCNERLKFRRLWSFARSLGAEEIATGHYARMIPFGRERRLMRGLDRSKDQSYVLFTLTGEERQRVLFPLGELTKEEVREIARGAGLATAEKAESQDICFVPSGDYSSFVEGRGGGGRAGAIRHVDGRLLGRHGGIHRFTVGQRKGLAVSAAAPLYVLRLDAGRNEVVVGPKEALGVPFFRARDWNWHVAGPERPRVARVQTRYRQEAALASLVEERGAVVVNWQAGPRSVTPGQAAVAYEGDLVLGGGWIEGPAA